MATKATTFSAGVHQPATGLRRAIYGLVAMLVIFYGLAAAVLPYSFVIVLFAIPFAPPIAAANMELALVGCAAAVLEIIPPSVLPSLPIGGATLRPGELVLMLLGLLVVLKLFMFKATPLVAILRPLKAPLALLGIMYVASITYSIPIKHDVMGLAEARNIIGWVTLPVAVYAFYWHFQRLDNYLRIFAILIAILLVAQTVSGIQLLFRTRGAETISQEYGDVVRSSAGAANYLIAYALYYFFGRAAQPRNRPFFMFLVLVLSLGLVVTFSRGIWAATAVGLIVFLVITKIHRRMPGTLVGLVLLATFTTAGLAVVKPNFVAAVVERVMSVQEEGGRGSSVGYRFDENSQALGAIAHNPFVGVGIGGEYKKFTGATGGGVAFDNEFTYIHNGYLGLAVKLGALAVLVPFWLFRNLWRVSRASEVANTEFQDLRLNVAAGISTVAMFMVANLSQPDWLRLAGLMMISLLSAIILVASWRLSVAGPSQPPCENS